MRLPTTTNERRLLILEAVSTEGDPRQYLYRCTNIPGLPFRGMLQNWRLNPPGYCRAGILQEISRVLGECLLDGCEWYFLGVLTRGSPGRCAAGQESEEHLRAIIERRPITEHVKTLNTRVGTIQRVNSRLQKMLKPSTVPSQPRSTFTMSSDFPSLHSRTSRTQSRVRSHCLSQDQNIWQHPSSDRLPLLDPVEYANGSLNMGSSLTSVAPPTYQEALASSASTLRPCPPRYSPRHSDQNRGQAASRLEDSLLPSSTRSSQKPRRHKEFPNSAFSIQSSQMTKVALPSGI